METRPIPDWPRYVCDREGNVFSLKAKSGAVRPMKARLSNSGYMFVHLRKPGKDGGQFVHRLVLRAWTGDSPDKPDVNHKNGDRLDNRLENLEWVTPKENQQHSIHVLGNKLGKPHYGTANSSAKLTPEMVRQMRDLYTSGVTSVRLGEMFGVSQPAAHAAVVGKTWRHVE